MFGPGLSQGLEFQIGGLTLEPGEVVADGLHLRKRQEQVGLAGQTGEFVIAASPEMHPPKLERIAWRSRERVGRGIVPVKTLEVPGLDALIAQHFPSDLFQVHDIAGPQDFVSPGGLHLLHSGFGGALGLQQSSGGVPGAHGHGVHDPGQSVDFNRRTAVVTCGEPFSDLEQLRYRVAEQILGEQADIRLGEPPGEEVDLAGGDSFNVFEADLADVCQHIPGMPVQLRGSRANPNMPVPYA